MQYTFSKYFFLFFSLILLTNPFNSLIAQNYVLSNWTVEDGLSSNDVRDLLQDKDGFIWIATEHGLNKFDGYTFRKHRYHPADSTTIGANFINSICEDVEGNIWVSLGVGIVSKYNKLSKKFSNYYFPSQDVFIYEIQFVSGFGMSIATNKGWYTIEKDGLKKIALSDEKNNSINFIYKVFPGSHNRIYLSTDIGFKLLDRTSNVLDPIFFIFDSDTIEFNALAENYFEDANGVSWVQTKSGSLCESMDGVYFKMSLAKPKGLSAKLSKNLFLFEDKQQTKWFCSNTKKLMTYDDRSHSWNIFDKQIQAPAFTFSDKDRNVWVCTQNNELLKWNEEQWEVVIQFENRLKYWEINDVFVDDKNGIWLSTREKGVWHIYNRKWPVSVAQNAISKENIQFPISALAVNHPDYMWLGGANNLYRFYFETEELTSFFSTSNKGNPLAGRSVNCVATRENNDIWIGTNTGLLIVAKDGKNVRIIKKVMIENEYIDFNYIRCLHSGPSGGMWLGTTAGLFYYKPEMDQWHHYLPAKEKAHNMRGRDIQCITQVNETDYLLGYIKFGVDLLSFNETDHSISCQNVTYHHSRMEQSDLMTANTFYQSDDEIWVGTFSKGLLKLDLKQLNMRPISEDFPIIPNVKGIQKGTKGKLWISSIDGIRSVNPSDETFYRFTKSSGLLSNQFRFNCAVQDTKGNLYFGSSKGLNKIQPSKWNNQDTVSTPILTDFKKYDKSLVFEMPLNEVKTIELNHQDDFITFEFVAPTYHNPKDVQYAYQLEGFDSDWRYSENQRSATYTNLDAGSYLFKVKAGNKGGFLNSKTKEVQIIIAPPFWETIWFILLMLGLLLFGLWLLYKIQSNIRKERLKIATEVRKKAANDFHDELGHRLTKIVLFVESLMLQKNNFPAQSAHILRKIQDNANELYYSTKDFIWAMNPSKDSVLELLILLRDFGDELFADTPIQFSVEGIKEAYKDQVLDMDWKRQLVMIFKEAMNNVLKHSDCTLAVLKIEQNNHQVKISLSDNGKGFVLDHEKFGYGLGSMVNRSKKVGGRLEIKTKIGIGTEVLLDLVDVSRQVVTKKKTK